MSLPRKPRAVVFDMDGLIFDTEVLYLESIIDATRQAGRDLPKPIYMSTIGLTGEGARTVLLDHFGRDFDIDALWETSERRFKELTETKKYLKAGVTELLDHLDEAELPRAIATSSRHDAVQHHLSSHDLTDRFATIVARGDYPRGKPNPDPFLTAAERLGVAPEDCVALEDSHNGVRAASSAGMMTVMVPDLLEPTEEMQALCVRIAEDLHEVLGVLRSIS